MPQPPAAPTPDETNDFEDAVATALRNRGLFVDQQVGASKFRIDLAIRDRRDTSRYILGVECDGATYHSTRTARDRDLLRQQVLESMGWRLHRVWSTEWFHNRDQALERILRSLALAEARPVEESVQGTPTDTQPPDSSPAAVPVASIRDRPPVQSRYRSGKPYAKFIGTGDRDLLTVSRRSGSLAPLVARIVELEGPIHEDLLAERLKEICGVERAGSNVQSNIGEAVHIALHHHAIERRRQRNFLWQKDAHLSTFRVPSDSVRRPLEWIHRDEVALAVLYLVEDQFGVMRSEIGRAVARLFGIERVSAEASDYVLEIADELLQSGHLREGDGRYFISE